MARTYSRPVEERTERPDRRYCDGCGRRGSHPDCARMDYRLDGPPERQPARLVAPEVTR